MAPSVIKIENLFKEYRLGNIGYGTLREDLESWWARINGKLDPNSIIGDEISQNVDLNRILALNNINLEVKEGERLGIIGKNGAGKTTLLKILSRISSPTKGSVKIKGRVASLIAVGTGFHGELTGRENIYLNGSILGLTKFEIDQCFDEIVDFSGVEQFIDTPVKRYSSGMNLRLGFAVAAHLDPDILIVDEVLAVGDAEFRKKALGKMKDVSDSEKRTILFVSHNMGAIKTLCEKCIL
ncbi:MAG: ABC transporter ATP-binding protein, partial [Candidatus Marinimicrobia bacterium]|nr:ABC transporter ATP-binding protein [Candidatus Neomarinimicrobiota bacterium]